jgi:T5SS/PEP-CTERM-associated repeat protein
MTIRSSRFAPITLIGLAILLPTCLHVNLSVADVTFFGSVDPEPPGDGDVESTLTVGLADDDDPDLRGYVSIDGGTTLEYDGLIVGDDEGYHGQMIISGTLTPGGQTSLALEEGGTTSVPTVQVGHEGVGQLTIEGGGSMILNNSNADLSIGVEASGVGTLIVKDIFSLVVIPDSHLIGDEGIGRMEILAGGIVHNTDTTNTAIIGATATGVGTVLVDGAGSIWKIDDDLVIGGDGLGTLTVSSQGLIDADQSNALTTIGKSGRLELAGGTFAGQNIALGGYLGGSGLVRGSVTGSVDALIDVPAGSLLQFANDLSNQGSIRVRGGEVEFLADLDNLASGGESAPGRITLEQGRVRFAQPLTNNGVIASAAGTNHLHGAITNGATGAIVVASDSVGIFHDTVVMEGGSLDLLAGANALFLADLTFETGSLAALEIGDLATGSAQMHVDGLASVAGGLEVELANGFSPSLGDSFQLLFAAEGVTGSFDPVALPALEAGLSWNLDYGTNSVVLEVLEASADFDLDGDVDGNDFLLWQRGGSPNPLSATELAAWQAQFGNGASPMTAAATGVPEPATGIMLLLGILSATPVCRWSAQRTSAPGRRHTRGGQAVR